MRSARVLANRQLLFMAIGPMLKPAPAQQIEASDQMLARSLRTVIADGVSGRLDLVRGGELQGPPWVETKPQRHSKADAVAARAKMAV
jgi:hypothetical protein